MTTTLTRSNFANYFTLDNSKSYKTEANLLAALEKLGFREDRYIVCLNLQGRFTAIFPQSNIQDGNAMRYAAHGFMTIG
ncbi:MAG: hypothetical protein BWY79_01814 [Actinobacteria bacterium ADurb.Bin444]|nr:MAG: hypothetical protein BWY79_01814 [Actinobacteria bacterium ADurb.Bin444]